MGPSSQHIWTREAVKVAGETWQRSQRSSPAAGSNIQPCGGFHLWLTKISFVT